MTSQAQRHRRPQSFTNPLAALAMHGQAVWLDYLARPLVADGKLRDLVERDGLTGVTSNPSIFEKAIGETADYDAALAAAEASGDHSVTGLYEALAIEDVREAAGVLSEVFGETDRADGYVSLEVSPYLAMDTEATVAEARRLWRAVDRDNIMIKVPATAPGLPAIRRLTREGINVNVTLLFSRQVYEQVVEAYLKGLEELAAQGGDPGRVASVASFFVSRIDVAAERLIEERMRRANGAQRTALAGLLGKVAIANAKLAYRRHTQLFAGPRWEALAAAGARAQRLLWASTSTKNKRYRDVLYVEGLIAPGTVDTMPPATMDAFRDHGTLRSDFADDIAQAEHVMATLEQFGIDIEEVAAGLVADGVRQFSDDFDRLLGAVARKRTAVLGERLDRQTHALAPESERAVAAALEAWRHDGNIRRLWARDASLWTGADEADWLGWLDIARAERARIDALARLAEEVGREDFSHLALLGMGGSSLGAEVLAATFGPQPGRPRLLVLDSTDPAQIRAVEDAIDPARTLFIVASKSGTTLEPDLLKDYFFARVTAAVGAERAGARFIAITDPGTPLRAVAARDRFRHVASGEPSIGGRYSVLSAFGLVPAALIGVDVARLLATTQKMVLACGADVPPADNPGVVLGTILGVLAKAGRDKVTIVASPGIAAFGAWLEQLLAESTGKHGRGLIPVDGEPLGAPPVYGGDRLFVHLRLASEPDRAQGEAIAALAAAGHPVVRIAVSDRDHVGQEFFRWEIATAVAGAIIGINPFDQPDVEASKAKTRAIMAAYEKHGRLSAETPLLEEDGLTLFADARNGRALGKAATLVGSLQAHFARIGPGDYCAILAFIARDDAHRAALQEMRRTIRDRTRAATCLGFGPRFLHSTGQAYKGGPDSGVFLQVTADDGSRLRVPGHSYTFDVVEAAQARGDFDVLAERGRRALRVHLGSDGASGLARLAQAVRAALA